MPTFASKLSRRPPGEWVLAALLVGTEALLALAGASTPLLAAAALCAPGFALIGLLPRGLRTSTPARWAAAPILGMTASTSLLITISWAGITLHPSSVRLALLGLLLVGVLLWPQVSTPDSPTEGTRGPVDGVTPSPRSQVWLESIALLAILGGALLLGRLVVGAPPVPGNDWAKYLLYADEIVRTGRLLIDNPFWMLGVPFREDPAIGAAYGSILLLSGAKAGALAQGILVVSLLPILGTFASVRAAWPRYPGAALIAAALTGAVPAAQGILGWHGLANVAGVGLLALLMSWLVPLVTAPATLDRRATVGLAVILIGLLATHRLTAVVAGLTFAVIVALAALTGQRKALGVTVRASLFAAVLGFGVIADTWARQKTFGGTLPASAYANTKVDLSLALRDLSWWLTGGTIAVVAVTAFRRTIERALWPWLVLALVCVTLAYSHVIGFPLYYTRMVFYLPLALGPIAAVCLWRSGLSRHVCATIGTTFVIVIVAGSIPQAREVKRYYAFASPASLVGLDALRGVLKPGEIVATDRCWSFLSTWLLRTRTLPALEPQDIQPKAEFAIARRAQAILRGDAEGRTLAREYGVRYAVVDPTCPDRRGLGIPPPTEASLVFASPRMAIVELATAPR